MQIRPAAEYDAVEKVLALSGHGFYLTIAMSSDELRSLRGVRDASWDERGSIRAGTTLGNAVHWCQSKVDPDALSILVGDSDETWDLALDFPADVLLSAVQDS